MGKLKSVNIFEENKDCINDLMSILDIKKSCIKAIKLVEEDNGINYSNIEFLNSADINNYPSGLFIIFDDNTMLHFFHYQEWVEQIYLESVDNYLNLLVGSKLLEIKEIVHEDKYDEKEINLSRTFYKIVTTSGYFTLRWHCERNNCYSKGVCVKYIADEEKIWCN